MSPFLHAVAADLLQRFGTNLSQLRLVFPGKRAGLFFTQALAKHAQTKSLILAPQYLTIGDLFQKLSPYTLSNPIQTVCELHACYVQAMQQQDPAFTPEKEPLEQFYGWGEVLLSDFNDMDKQLVSVEKLFTQISDWGQLSGTTDFLSEEQQAALQRYFQNFRPEHSHWAKQRFLQLWKAMPTIYAELHQRQKARSVLYEGALYRDVVENHLHPLPENVSYVFIGFNILAKAEWQLMKFFQDTGQTLFYWDVDEQLPSPSYHIQSLWYEASSYVRDYMRDLPNSLPTGQFATDTPIKIRYIKSDSANAQVHYAPIWLETHTDPAALPRTAVILADESLLPQLLSTLPALKTNITMGFRLSDTPVVSYVDALAELQRKGKKTEGEFYSSYLQRVEQHPFAAHTPREVWEQAINVQNGDEVLAYLSRCCTELLRVETNGSEDPHTALYAEAVYRCHYALETLRKLALPLSGGMICRLLHSLLARLSVPFHGEPIEGLQIMGMLETRCLDFDHLLILSACDGNLPKGGRITSLIPYCLRSSFGLTSEQEQVSLYAYNFYRLLARAQDVTLLFSPSEALGQGEMSRFMRQILAETTLPVECTHLDFHPKITTPTYPNSFPKTTEQLRQINRLSASAINQYLHCPLAFYYQRIKGLQVQQAIESNLAANQFGSVFHKAAYELYQTLAKKDKGNITDEDLKQVLHDSTNRLVREVTHHAFQTLIFNPSETIKDYTGELVIAQEVIITYLQRLLRLDQTHTPFRILGLEESLSLPITLSLPDGPHTLQLEGVIDRIDCVEKHPATGQPALRIVDYKTGGQPSEASSSDIANLFQMNTKKPAKYLLQTCLYAHIACNHPPTNDHSLPLMPSVLYIHKAGKIETYDDRVMVGKNTLNDYRPIDAEFTHCLHQFLEQELFNPAQPYCATTYQEHCTYCNYRLLCGK